MSSEDPLPQVPASPSPRTLSLGIRLVYMIVFALVFWILCWTLAVTTLAQLLLTLLAGRPQPDLVRFGTGLALYSRQIIEFLTFVNDRISFPFSEWPET